MCSILDHKPAFVEPGEPKNCSKRPNSGTLNSTNQKLKSDSTQAGINSSQIIKRSTRKKKHSSTIKFNDYRRRSVTNPTSPRN